MDAVGRAIDVRDFKSRGLKLYPVGLKPDLVSGVRPALGADHHRVLRLVLGEGARLIAMGLLIGAPGIYVAGRLIRGVLVGVSPLDPLTLATVGIGLGLVALAACYVPARRVLWLEPAQSLRQE